MMFVVSTERSAESYDVAENDSTFKQMLMSVYP